MMAQRGTLKNGVIVPDEPATLPDGTRIEWTEVESWPHPMASADGEQETALVLARIAAVAAGEATIPLDEAMAELTRRQRARAAGG